MIRIYDHCLSKGITEQKKIGFIGHLVSEYFVQKNLIGRILVESVEPTGVYQVWAYPDEHVTEIDKVIVYIDTFWGQPKPKKKKKKKAVEPAALVVERRKRPRIQRNG